MNDPQEPHGDASREPVGSVGEEAAKLFGVLSAWAREQEPGRAAGAAHEAVAHGLHEVGEHVAAADGPDGQLGADCRWCPVCQVVHVVRQTSPEVRAHLASAAGSLAQAVAGLLATPPSTARGPVERIDLDGDLDGPEEKS